MLQPFLSNSHLTRHAATGVVVLLLGLQFSQASFATDSERNASRFSRTIAGLGNVEPDEKREFARIAINQLFEIYLAESELAYRESLEGEKQGKLSGWSHAVEQYSEDLYAMSNSIDTQSVVSFISSSHGIATLLIDERVLMLTHPRPDQQYAYEQIVLSTFCSKYDCARFNEEALVESPITFSQPIPAPEWSFKGSGMDCHFAKINLIVRFGNLENLQRKRQLCKQLIAEVSGIEAEIRWQMRHGAHVNWPDIRIEATPGRVTHVLHLNQGGDVVLFPLPLLYSTPNLFSKMRPWFELILAKQTDSYFIILSEDYAWQLD